MKSIKFEDYLLFEKVLIFVGIICWIISMSIFGLTFLSNKIDGYYAMVTIGIILSIGIISFVVSLMHVLLRLIRN